MSTIETVSDDTGPAAGPRMPNTPRPEAGAPVAAAPAAADVGRRAVLVPVLTAVIVALVGGAFLLGVTGFNALRDDMNAGFARIDERFAQIDARFTQIDARFVQVDARSDALDAKIESQIGMLRDDMNEGFASVNAILLDHTDRLARLEAAAGLPRSVESVDPARSVSP